MLNTGVRITVRISVSRVARKILAAKSNDALRKTTVKKVTKNTVIGPSIRPSLNASNP